MLIASPDAVDLDRSKRRLVGLHRGPSISEGALRDHLDRWTA
jgi:hypothetical protein